VLSVKRYCSRKQLNETTEKEENRHKKGNKMMFENDELLHAVVGSIVKHPKNKNKSSNKVHSSCNRGQHHEPPEQNQRTARSTQSTISSVCKERKREKAEKLSETGVVGTTARPHASITKSTQPKRQTFACECKRKKTRT
jgi:hypothetical protein